jgi:hypothetical protein
MSLTDSVRVVDLGNGSSEERQVTLTELDAPWLFAALRQLEWLKNRLK